MANPTDHFGKIEHEINWMGLNGHLDTLEKKEAVNDISVAIHKARKVFEKKDNGEHFNN